MEIHQVRYFMALCAAGNFTHAARQCNVSQPSLTTAIKKLEAEFGGELFHRERRQATLTRLGRSLKPHLEQIMAASAAAKSEASQFASEERSVLTLGAMATISPLQLVAFFEKLHDVLPHVDLIVREAPGAQLVTALLDGEIDVALIGLPVLPEQFYAVPLYQERYAIAFAEGHVFARETKVDVAQLNGVDYVSRLHCEFVDYFEALDLSLPFQPHVRYTSEREDWIQAMILAKRGCTIVPEFMPLLPGIQTRLLQNPEVERSISLVTVAGRRHSPALARLVRLAQHYSWPHNVSP